MDVVPADDHRYKFADNKWYVKFKSLLRTDTFSLCVGNEFQLYSPWTFPPTLLS